ncbi:S8 family serine peptidase [Streptomyces albus]|uniref:S8 family serine peptidase n=1 Tax=Streptomyces albus TaxID=1888 RepID=UPI0036F842BC
MSPGPRRPAGWRTLSCALATAVLAAAAPGAAVAVAPATASAAPVRTPPRSAPEAGSDAPSLPRIPAVLDDRTCTEASRKAPRMTPWQQTLLNPSAAWRHSTGRGVTVAVVDTGVAADGVPALAGRVASGEDGGSATEDCVGHGTFVAGLIAAARSKGTGFAGIAPDARILAVRGTDRQGRATAEGMADGIDAAVRGGARVICVPRALPRGGPALTAAVRRAVQRDALVVAPAYAPREDDEDAPAPAAWPARLPGVLAVAALTPQGAADQTRAPRTRPDLAAPGVSVMSTGPRGDGYFTGSGAEFAAALVAGTAALVDEYRPGLSAAQLAERLTGTAYRPAPDTERRLVGAGTVDPVAAVTGELGDKGDRAEAAPAAAPHVPAPPPDTGRDRALLVAGGVTAVILLVALGAVAVPLGRRRGWRPGRLPPSGPPGAARP